MKRDAGELTRRNDKQTGEEALGYTSGASCISALALALCGLNLAPGLPVCLVEQLKLSPCRTTELMRGRRLASAWRPNEDFHFSETVVFALYLVYNVN